MTDERLQAIGEQTSKAVRDAASVLEKELAKGIDEARRLQRGLIDTRRVDQADFEQVTSRFRDNAHELISMLADRLAELRTPEVQSLSDRLTTDAHSVFDAVMDLVNAAPAVVNRLADRIERMDERLVENSEQPPVATKAKRATKPASRATPKAAPKPAAASPARKAAPRKATKKSSS